MESLNSIKYFQNIKQFFIKKGKKSRIENLMRSFLIKNAKLKKRNIHDKLKMCVSQSTPYIRLKTKRRGKRVKYKIDILKKEKGVRKALSALSKDFKKQKGFNFVTTIEKEIEMLNNKKNSITEKRNEIHKLALLNSPFRWKKVSSLVAQW